MTVYIEYVILDNFLFTFLIAFFSYKLLKEKPSKLRCALAATVGTACAILYPFIKAAWLVALFKAALCIVMCLILYLKRGKFLISSLSFLVCTAALGGLQFMIGFLVHGNASAALRLPISELPLSIFFLPPIILLLVGKKIFDYLNAHRLRQNYVYDLTLTIGDKSKRLKGLIDTGNMAKASKSVVFIGRITALDILGTEYLTALKRAPSMKIVTAAGEKNILLLPGKIDLYLSEDEHIFMDVQVGIGDIKNTEYQAILPLSVLGKEGL